MPEIIATLALFAALATTFGLSMSLYNKRLTRKYRYVRRHKR
jgi:hypothetical protein